MHHKPRKWLGQHFLRDRVVIEHIVSFLQPQPGEALVEIGPGLGALTEPVVRCVHRLVAVEYDRDLVAHLTRHAYLAKRLELYQQDVLTVDWQGLAHRLGAPLRIFGNLSYAIATPLLFLLFEQCAHIEDIHVMLQAEVVQRLAATPNSKAYGCLSVLAQYFCQITPLFSVPPTAFYPPPKVVSAVVRLQPYCKSPYLLYSHSCLQQICKAAFGQRRKTLRNSLSAFFTAEALCTLEIDPTWRAENLTVAHYCKLANTWAQRTVHTQS